MNEEELKQVVETLQELLDALEDATSYHLYLVPPHICA